ncbi:GntR family transcriptional regulator [Aureimonas sp. N4]|uniref:GntR family transcriptional regulator n=1 Tax=Aureimonas sp. N4 TaxID=1638165 RepID=UPI0007805371|nr:GntR family transcriptional regulator [Aureimonas sp. N4]
MQDRPSLPSPSAAIDTAILRSILARRLRPGARLGEGELASLFNVSRTLVREALMRLASRHIVEVRSRRGWFVVEPSSAEAKRVFEARRAVEAGMMRIMPALEPDHLALLQTHLSDERAALAAGDHPRLVCLMGDFHIRLGDIVANPVLSEILRDLTARTILISMLYQSTTHAEESHLGHCRIVEALARGDRLAASDLAIRHLDEVEAGLDLDMAADPLADLRRSLDPTGALASPAFPTL